MKSGAGEYDHQAEHRDTFRALKRQKPSRVSSSTHGTSYARSVCFSYSEGAMAKLPRRNSIPIMRADEELAAVDARRLTNQVATRSDPIRRQCQMGLQSDNPDAAQDTGS